MGLARGFDYCGGVCVGMVCFGVVCDCARWCLFGLIWVLGLVVDLGFGFVCGLGGVGVWLLCPGGFGGCCFVAGLACFGALGASGLLIGFAWLDAFALYCCLLWMLVGRFGLFVVSAA